MCVAEKRWQNIIEEKCVATLSNISVYEMVIWVRFRIMRSMNLGYKDLPIIVILAKCVHYKRHCYVR